MKIVNNTMRPNIVYVSSILKEKFPNAAKELFSVLRKYNVTVKELTHTKDIWCRICQYRTDWGNLFNSSMIHRI